MYRIIKTNKSWIESEAEEQIIRFSNLKGMERVIAYPDLHPGKTPVGVAYISKDIIYPYLVGNDIGCSISLYGTSCSKKKFRCEKIVKKLEEFMKSNDISTGVFNKGTIGSGNHFGEFTSIAKVYCEETLKKANIDPEKIYLLVHSGSRGLGEYVLRKYIEEYNCQNGLNVGSEGFVKYMTDYEKAIEFSRESREIIAEKLCDATNIPLEDIIIEAIHNGIEKRDEYFIHRKGAAPANVEYLIIAGSRGSSSYIVKPIKDTLEFGYSLAHGAGRKWGRGNCKEKLQGKYLRKNIRRGNLGYNLVCSDKTLIYEEAPEAYKNIERVIEDLLEFEMIELVAELKPLVTYKA